MLILHILDRKNRRKSADTAGTLPTGSSGGALDPDGLLAPTTYPSDHSSYPPPPPPYSTVALHPDTPGPAYW